MQVVGRTCDVCELSVKSELDGVACLRCERVFHDACVSTRAETYRTATPKDGAKAKRAKAPKSTLCPTCGADVRALKRERDRSAAAEREELEGRRRSTVEVGGRPNTGGFAILRIFLGLLMLLLGAYLRWRSHQ